LHPIINERKKMKKGKDIESLAAELVKIRASAKDIIVPTAKMRMVVTNPTSLVLEPEPRLQFDNGMNFGFNNWPHQQVASYTNIPKGYYDKIKEEDTNVLAVCVNHGFQMAINMALAKKRPKHDSRLIRTVGGNIRGFLSDRYRVLDCYDLFETVAPILIENGFEVLSSELTERRMYIKAVTPKIQGDIIKGHPVQYGIVISSSDVGCGSVRVEPFLYELVCTNGMTMEQTIKKFHLGGSNNEDDITELLTNEAKEARDKATWLEVRDTVRGSMEYTVFERNLDKLRVASGQPIRAQIPDIVEVTMKEVGVTGDERKNDIIKYLANGADGRGMNKWALANAFTWAAQSDAIDYDTASELERAGGKIIELPNNKWERLNKAA